MFAYVRAQRVANRIAMVVSRWIWAEISIEKRDFNGKVKRK